MLETVAQAVINGLLIGGIYALVSIGVTLIFGVVKIVNFAQGEFVMIGMYISFFLGSTFGVDPLLSLLISMPSLFAIALLLFTANYRTVQTPYSELTFHIGPVYFAVAKLIAFAIAMLLSALLYLFLHGTDLGT